MILGSKLGSRFVQTFNKRTFCTKVTENLKATNVATSVVKNKKPSRKLKILLTITTIPSVAFYGYYSFFLNDQERRRVRVNIKSVYRATRSFQTGFHIALDYKWNLWRLDEDSVEYDTAIKGCHSRSAERMVKACIENGGLYVKLGQGLSTMNQVLPEEFYMPLRRLQNEALRSEGTDIDELFMEEFNKKPKEIFAEFDYTPLAAASLAQVHKAIGNDGKEYAVKLQYIDLQDRFQGDIFTCQTILKLIAWSFPSFSFSWILDELKGTLEKELDFLNEGKNGERCYNELKHLKYVYVPKIFWDKSSKRVLTMEFINGVKISDLEGIKKLGLNLKDVDTKLVNAFAEQVFHSGFVHADPHHANVYVRKLGNTNEAEIVLLDHGLYEYISPEDRKNLCKLWKSIILKDEEKMKYYSTKLKVKEENYMALAAFLMMRPLHRPVHEKFVFAEVWDKMSEIEKEQANKEDSYTLCEMLIMQPLRLRTSNFQLKLKLDEDEVLKVREEVRNNFHKIQAVLREIALCMLLVLRNLNTIRSVVHDHGNIVDRHTLMARSAIFGAYKDELKVNLTHRVKAWFELRFFDLILFYDRVTRYIGTVYMTYVLKNNTLSKEIMNEINKTMEKI